MPGAIFEEHFAVLDIAARPLATFDDGSPAAFEHAYGAGRAIVAGSFPGQASETAEAVDKQRSNIIVGSVEGAAVQGNPLGAFLAKWAGLALPNLKTGAPVDLRELDADGGRFLFRVNWETRPARIDLATGRAKRVREIATGRDLPANGRIQDEVPAGGVRVYRLEN